MRGCIARVCFVLLGLQVLVVVERPQRGSVYKKGEFCVCVCVQRLLEQEQE